MNWIMQCLHIAIMATALGCAAASPAYPIKPIRIIHPYAPGGGTETQARALARHMSDSWRQPIIIDSRPGAGSALGAQIVAQSAPDGYTLLFNNAAFAAVSALSKKPLFNPVRDFAPIVRVGTAPLILVAHRSLPPTLHELLAHARANPGALNFGSAGTGAASHLAMEHFKSMAGIDIVHVPYKGSNPAVVALLSGEIHLSMFSAGSVLAHIRSGKIHALAITTTKQSKALPDLPPIAQVGLAGYEVVQWSGVFAPAGTPKEIVQSLNQKINESLTLTDVKEQLSKIGVEPAGGTVEQFTQFIRVEVVKWSKVIEHAGIKTE